MPREPSPAKSRTSTTLAFRKLSSFQSTRPRLSRQVTVSAQGHELVVAIARDVADDDPLGGYLWSAQVEGPGHVRRLFQAASQRGNGGQGGIAAVHRPG